MCNKKENSKFNELFFLFIINKTNILIKLLDYLESSFRFLTKHLRVTTFCVHKSNKSNKLMIL